MYRICKPMRVAPKEENMFMVSFPALDIKVEINQNVLDLLFFLIRQKAFDDSVVNIYLKDNNISNQREYDILVEQMKEIGIIKSE